MRPDCAKVHSDNQVLQLELSQQGTQMHKLYRAHSFYYMYGSVVCVNLGRLFGDT